MRAKGCRDRRVALGSYALGHLSADERWEVEVHLERCEDCREEVRSLSAVARLLPYADPARFGPAPKPSPHLGEWIAAQIGAERRTRGRRRRCGFPIGASIAAAAAVLAIAVLPIAGGEPPRQHVGFTGLPSGAKMRATLEPEAYGTEIHVYVSGISSGTLCRVFLRGSRGQLVDAGTFRYRPEDEAEAELTAALALSGATAVEIRAGTRVYRAPLEAVAAA